jgi:hypothetical protein
MGEQVLLLCVYCVLPSLIHMTFSILDYIIFIFRYIYKTGNEADLFSDVSTQPNSMHNCNVTQT